MNCRNCAGPCCLKGSNHEGDCEGYTPMTNLERIKTMGEELAEFYCNDVGACPPGSDMKCIDELYAHGEGPYPSDEQCHKCWLDWLKQEAKHE